MMRRSVFDEVGGLDAVNLAVAYNDVDMCLRIRERGYRVVYTPYAVLFHHESATRTMHSNPDEAEYLQRRWSGVIHHDPFYNPNLTREADDYSLNFDAPTVAERLGLIGDGPSIVRHGSDHPGGTAPVAHHRAGPSGMGPSSLGRSATRNTSHRIRHRPRHRPPSTPPTGSTGTAPNGTAIRRSAVGSVKSWTQSCRRARSSSW